MSPFQRIGIRNRVLDVQNSRNVTADAGAILDIHFCTIQALRHDLQTHIGRSAADLHAYEIVSHRFEGRFYQPRDM